MAKKRKHFFENTRNFIRKVAAKILTRNAVTFLGFFLLSSFFWFILSVNTPNEKTIKVPIKYVGLSDKYMITNELPQNLNILVKDNGKELNLYWHKKIDSATVDLTRRFESGRTINYSTKQLTDDIASQLPKTVKIVSVSPEIIKVEYHKLAQKELPVQLQGDYSLAPLFVLSDSVSIEPAKITVFGAKKTLDSLKCVNVTKFSQLNLTTTTTFSQPLEPIDLVKFSTENVQISIPVEITTEKQVTLPIQVLHCPEEMTLRTFPTSVTATFSIGLSQFNKISEKDIRISIDYKTLSKQTDNKFPLQVRNNNSAIKNLRISPAEVEILLEKK